MSVSMEVGTYSVNIYTRNFVANSHIRYIYFNKVLITARKLVTTCTYNLHTILHLQSASDEGEALRVKVVGQIINSVH